jgi:hypothetical protein
VQAFVHRTPCDVLFISARDSEMAEKWLSGVPLAKLRATVAATSPE